MLPYITIFGRQLSTYAVMGSIGFFVMWLAAWLATKNRKEIDQNHVPHIALSAMGGLCIGAPLLYGAVNFHMFINAARDHFSQMHSYMDFFVLFAYIFGGMVFYGGLFGALAGAALYIRALKLPYQLYFDVIAFCIPLFHGFARIGCFLGGCCYGIEWEHGFVFHNSPELSANGVPRFPVQLLESGLEFALFAVILVLYLRRRLSGKLIYVYLLSYAVIRFFDEFLRGDRTRGTVGILSTSQFISVLLFVTVVTVLIVNAVKKRDASSPDAGKE